MAVAQIPNMPAMPDIQGGYAKIGEQIAGIGKQIGGAIVDFASAQGKKKLVDEIKVKYPSVVQAYPEDVLMQMDNKELGQRLAAVVGIENAIPKLKEVDPKFSTADIEQMKAEIFKAPDQARTIAKDWMAIAEKNRQEGIDKEFLAMPTTTGGQPAQPAMPQVEPHSTAQPLVSPEMQNLKGQEYIDAMAAQEASKPTTPAMPAVPGKPMTKETFYSDAATRFSAPPTASAQTFKDKGMQSQKDIDAANFKTLSLEQKKALADRNAKMKADQFRKRMAQGDKSLDLQKALLGITAMKGVATLREDQSKIFDDASEAEITATALRQSGNEDLAKAYEDKSDKLWANYYSTFANVTAAQGTASGLVSSVNKIFPEIEKNVKLQQAYRKAQTEFEKSKTAYAEKGIMSFDDLIEKYPDQAKKAVNSYMK